ncbi:LOW QUALITY PROTEIN: PPR domain-containing protein/Acid_phosphat_B domain-containing protein/PPR_1 domain-containing protein/PPR_2 domain-containing protein [Cephalotus follicularis]|uniref:PPR domain-containing protein/Acid_phosphat_B domain-containing protein/PPR_1 domain-containing protein/PPR_2 domain-containing protein n=1 Tax=Cephalotus follicularis TaxID=3775 RepID=A0A1Q3C756_CEPFO|nr:LOW QUALITY PROTEIN: PPR domain-containing protein/Acid_phosphat_B domain-containing protein/PPR_1 domain-containing protein/PPR_2 domain-containing protein [Cephalotus follicularis]
MGFFGAQSVKLECVYGSFKFEATAFAVSTMRGRLHNHLDLLRSTTTNRRHFATKYTAKITSTSPTGSSVSAEVDLPPPLPSDSRGYPIPRRHLICKATQILLSRQSRRATSHQPLHDPFSDLSDYFSSLSISLTPSEASEILKSLNCPRLALSFFQFCPELSPNFQHDPFTYNRMLLILSKSTLPNRIDLIRTIMNQMEKSDLRGTISTVNILIGVFSHGEDLERCVGLVKKWGLKMNCYTYKCLLQAHLRSREVHEAFCVYLHMRIKGYKLDIFGYNMLLDALAKEEKVDQVYKVFEDMKRKHCEPDQYTYTIMIKMTGKAGKHDESLVLFDEMLTTGCSPNLIAYNTMIEALANARMVDKVILLFCKMVERDCRPNEFTYSVILNVLVAERQLSKLDEVVEVSKKYMNKSIYAFLVRMLNKLGHASDAHRLFCNMWNFHDWGDRDAYKSMLENLCNAGKITEAMDLLNNIHEKGVSTDTIMYNTVFSAIGKSKQISYLHDLYEKMKQDGPSPDIFTYNILISSFGRVGQVDEAVKFFGELENSHFKPDIISYNSLINCLGKNGGLDEAHMRFKEMQEKGLNPDVVTYSTLIECFGKTDKVEMACRLFDEMLAEGCYPNIVTYNILLDCLERSGRTAEAVDLYAKLKQQGLTPDSITYAVLERLQSGTHRKFRVRRQNPITGWVVSPLSAHQIHLLRPQSGAGGQKVAQVSCLSWRFAVETNNIRGWSTVPHECEGYVGHYMLGDQYREDSKEVLNEAFLYAQSLKLAGDGKYIWVFDIDETSLSNLPYYAEHGFGIEPYNSTLFTQWVNKGIAPALPETLEFFKKLLSLEIKVVFLTGRVEAQKNVTSRNLKMVGYHSWDKLLLRGSSYAGNTSVLYKSSARGRLVKDGYRIIGNIGDQWSDLLGTNEGRRTFKLPDPMYYIS